MSRGDPLAARPGRDDTWSGARAATLTLVSERYVPAAGQAALTPLFDWVNAITMRQGRWRPVLVALVRAGKGKGSSIWGAETGAMSIAVARELPAASVIGVDAIRTCAMHWPRSVGF